jgi:alpha-beta hydrolase superfamily lysophospholipase
MRLARTAFLALALGACMPPSWGANALLHPGRRAAPPAPAQAHEDVGLRGEGGIALAGWIFRTSGQRRGTVIYLHGLSDNRGSSVWLARHLGERGFDVVAYDSRAHGQSGGDACTYGFYEKQDLARVLDQLQPPGPIILFGNSMGAAVALQAAAEDARIAGVVAIATISDLRTAAFERAPFIASRGNVEEALRIAEQEGRFAVDQVSPVAAAVRIVCPVLLIHGEDDRETPPAHSRRVFEALPAAANKRLLIVPGAGHGNVLRAETWKEIDRWLDQVIERLPTADSSRRRP